MAKVLYCAYSRSSWSESFISSMLIFVIGIIYVFSGLWWSVGQLWSYQASFQSRYIVLFLFLHNIGSCALVKTLCYTLVALLFFHTSFFTSFVLHIHTIASFFATILSSSGICPLSSVFNMFCVFKSPKRRTAIFPSHTSKRGHSAPQPISPLCALKMRRPLFMPLLPLS